MLAGPSLFSSEELVMSHAVIFRQSLASKMRAAGEGPAFLPRLALYAVSRFLSFFTLALPL